MIRQIIMSMSILIPTAFANAQLDSSNIRNLINSISRFINGTIIPLFIAATLAYTIYAVVTFIAAGDDMQKKEERKKQIFWGIIGLFVILSIWGLIGIIGNSFGIQGGKLILP